MNGILRVVTLWRPWDYAIARLDKRVENRNWTPALRCPWFLAIRGGRAWEPAVTGAPREADWPAGRVSCVAEVLSYEPPVTIEQRPGESLNDMSRRLRQETERDRWRSPEVWGWRLGRVAALPEPIIWPPGKETRHPEDRRSMQGLVTLDERWPYDSALLAALRQAWAESFAGGVGAGPEVAP